MNQSKEDFTMEKNTKFPSQENLEKLNQLSNELCSNGIRLMLDPQKTTSPEGIIEDVVSYLEERKNNFANSVILNRIS